MEPGQPSPWRQRHRRADVLSGANFKMMKAIYSANELHEAKRANSSWLLAPIRLLLAASILSCAMLDLVGAEAGLAGYHTKTIEGWTVHVSDELLTKQKDAVEAALPLLQKQLAEIVNVVPAP